MGASAERRAFTLHTDAGRRRLVGDFGARELVVIDLATKQPRTIQVGRDVASFSVDPAMRRVVGRSFKPSWEKPSPKLAVRGGLVAVSDHRRDRVTVLRASGLRHVETLRVPGAPTDVALAG